jgi:hypothetical protein
MFDLHPQPCGEGNISDLVMVWLSSEVNMVYISQWPKWLSTSVPLVGIAIFMSDYLLKILQKYKFLSYMKILTKKLPEVPEFKFIKQTTDPL